MSRPKEIVSFVGYMLMLGVGCILIVVLGSYITKALGQSPEVKCTCVCAK